METNTPVINVASLSLVPLTCSLTYFGTPPEGFPSTFSGEHLTTPDKFYSLPLGEGFRISARPAPEQPSRAGTALLIFNRTPTRVQLDATAWPETGCDHLLPGQLARFLPHVDHAIEVRPQLPPPSPCAQAPVWKVVPGKDYTVSLHCGCTPDSTILHLVSHMKRFPTGRDELTSNPWHLLYDAHCPDHLDARASPESTFRKRNYPSLETAFGEIGSSYQEQQRSLLRQANDLFRSHLSHHIAYVQHRQDFLAVVDGTFNAV